MKPRVYIDGSSGTTGLQIYDRLAAREDIELLLIDEAKHRDTTNRARLMNTADIVFLCLPDAAAVEAVELSVPTGSMAFLSCPPCTARGLPTPKGSATPAAMQRVLSALSIHLSAWDSCQWTHPWPAFP